MSRKVLSHEAGVMEPLQQHHLKNHSHNNNSHNDDNNDTPVQHRAYGPWRFAVKTSIFMQAKWT
ncbi:MAG: hypothetical protein LGB06_07290 [Sulfurovum sp.]|nr:hypothetical protein [Sulfurovum sp.]